MSYAITIIADDDDMELVESVAAELDEVTLSTPEPLATSGAGQNFPIEPHTAIESLQVIAAFVSTTNGVRQLLEAWGKRREKRQQPPAVIIADDDSGERLYEGSHVDHQVVQDVIGTLARKPEDG